MANLQGDIRWITIVLFCILSQMVAGQIIYTLDFTKAIEKSKIEFKKPNNIYLHPQPEIDQSIIQFNLSLVSDDEKIEVKYLTKEMSFNIPDKAFDLC